MTRTLAGVLAKYGWEPGDLWDDSGEVRVFIPQMIPVRSITPNAWNPQEMGDAEFNLLAENIREIGFMSALQVMPISSAPEEFQEQNADKDFVLIGGQSRTDVMRLLSPDSNVPAVVLLEIDLDRLKMQTVALNVIQGKLSPQRMTALWSEMAKKYGEELTQSWFGFARTEELQRVVKGLKGKLPANVLTGVDLDAAAEEVQTVDDLAAVIREIFQSQSHTTEYGFMAFVYKGRTHYMVRMNDRLRRTMRTLFDKCIEEERGVSDVLNELLPDVIEGVVGG